MRLIPWQFPAPNLYLINIHELLGVGNNWRVVPCYQFSCCTYFGQDDQAQLIPWTAPEQLRRFVSFWQKWEWMNIPSTCAPHPSPFWGQWCTTRGRRYTGNSNNSSACLCTYVHHSLWNYLQGSGRQFYNLWNCRVVHLACKRTSSTVDLCHSTTCAAIW